MSMDIYATHLYGAVTTSANELRDIFVDEGGFADIYEIRDYFNERNFSELPEADKLSDDAKRMEMIFGPDDIMYIGVSATMPFEKPIMSRERIESAVDEVGRGLFGEDTKLVCNAIFDKWEE